MHTESLPRPLRLRWTERGAGWLAGAGLIALAVLAPLCAAASPGQHGHAAGGRGRDGDAAGHGRRLAGDRLRLPHAPHPDLGAAAAAGRTHLHHRVLLPGLAAPDRAGPDGEPRAAGL
ncbi:hypothetical protein G6F24_017331 [Rhizopus arrhizus]|nr:hypothetical protein G6F24_017331 [Rhizopus arrhizus]